MINMSSYDFLPRSCSTSFTPCALHWPVRLVTPPSSFFGQHEEGSSSALAVLVSLTSSQDALPWIWSTSPTTWCLWWPSWVRTLSMPICVCVRAILVRTCSIFRTMTFVCLVHHLNLNTRDKYEHNNTVVETMILSLLFCRGSTIFHIVHGTYYLNASIAFHFL